MPRAHDGNNFEPLQPEILRDKIVPLLVHPADSPIREEEEPWMNRSAYAVNSGARSTKSREERRGRSQREYLISTICLEEGMNG